MMAHHTPNTLASALDATGKTLPLLADLPPAPARQSQAADLLKQIKQAEQDNPAIGKLLDVVAEEVRKAADPAAVIDRVLELLTPKTPCPALGGACVADHTDSFVHPDDDEHRGQLHGFADGNGQPDHLNMRLASTADGSRRFVELWGFSQDGELTPAEARAYAIQLRASAERLDQLAATLDAVEDTQ
ncbi:DUF6907 domain-containing protein [Streptomyces sp. NPDC090021]|uniref:DUF6907 domain-containing protein n=1 Tax=Streptomyces sp. NPDC090021 TaxID=3365919 RepID=UPI0038003D88